jgi:DNA-binding NtrC family response regulator
MDEATGGIFRVLVVEDQSRYRDLLVREVAALGFGCAGAASAEEARDLLRRDDFQVVMLDLHLPCMSGMELFAWIRGQSTEVEVVVLTAYGDLDTSVQALRWRAADYLTKPCSLDEIERVLCRLHARWLDRSRSHLDQTVEGDGTGAAAAPAGAGDPGTLAHQEREHILRTLAACGGHKPSAARKLGISLRTLYNKIRAYESA